MWKRVPGLGMVLRLIQKSAVSNTTNPLPLKLYNPHYTNYDATTAQESCTAASRSGQNQNTEIEDLPKNNLLIFVSFARDA
jgi:hypothetical protein